MGITKATNLQISQGAPGNLNWKGGFAGTPYIDEDIVSNVQTGDIIMCQVDNQNAGFTGPEIVQIEFPASTPANAGWWFTIINLQNKKIPGVGQFNLVPGQVGNLNSDLIGQTNEPGGTIMTYSIASDTMMTFMSTGQAQWVQTSSVGSVVLASQFTVIPIP